MKVSATFQKVLAFGSARFWKFLEVLAFGSARFFGPVLDTSWSGTGRFAEGARFSHEGACFFSELPVQVLVHRYHVSGRW